MPTEINHTGNDPRRRQFLRLPLAVSVYARKVSSLIESALVITLCIMGFLFEFMLELPFWAIVGMSRRLGKKPLLKARSTPPKNGNRQT